MAVKTLLDSLRAEFQEKNAEAQALLDKKDRTGDETNRAIALVGEVKAVKGRIDSELTLDAHRKEMGEIKSWADEPGRVLPFSGGGDGASLLDGSQKAGRRDLHFKDGSVVDYSEVGPGTFGSATWDALCSKDYSKIYRKFLRKGEKAMSGMEMKELQLGLDDQGGVFAPAEWMNRVISRKPAPTSVLNHVTRLTTARQKVVMPRLLYSTDDIYTTAFRVTKTGEIPASDTAAAVDNTNFSGTVSIDVNTFMMSLPISLDLIEDAGFPMDAYVSGKFGETAMLFMEDRALNGTGASEPDGILNKAQASALANRPEVVLSGSAGAIIYDGLIDCQTALPPQYESDVTRWVMNKKSTYRALLKIKDSNNRPLFAEGTINDGMTVRRERVLLGDPILLSQFMPNIGSAAFPIIYGDFRGYYQVDRVGFSIQVLREVGYRANTAILVGRFRFGGSVVEPWMLKIQKSNNT